MTYDPDLIGALFAENITYGYYPYDDRVLGRHAVVASWVGESDAPGVSARDAPGMYDANYAAIAVDGDVAVARCHHVVRGTGRQHRPRFRGDELPPVKWRQVVRLRAADGDEAKRRVIDALGREPDKLRAQENEPLES